MSWQVGERVVAEATGATVRGSGMAGGASLHIDVALRLVEWPWKENGSVYLVPQLSEVTARLARGELSLGFAQPNPTCIVSPASCSSTGQVQYSLALTTAALVALETARDGGPIAFFMSLVAHPARISQHQGYPASIEVASTIHQRLFDVPKEQWLTVLKSVGYCDAILTELKLPTAGASAEHLARAVAARNEGRYSDAIAACRNALEHPKRPNGEFDRIVNASRTALTDHERFLYLRTVTQIFASPASHGATHHEREDAELVIAMTSALVRLAPRWNAEHPSADDEKAGTP